VARDLYQNTIALADATGTLKALSGVQVFVYLPGTTNPATIYTGRTGGAQAGNPMLTDATGLVEFYAEVGEYDIRVLDTVVPNRIADRTVPWNAINASDNGIPTSKLAGDGGIGLAEVAADLLRQVIPIGQVIDWWRPNDTFPLPGGFVVCAGQTLLTAEHDFGTGGSIVVPDLRNMFILGADDTKAGGTAAGTTDTAGAAPGIRGAGGSQTHVLTAAQTAIRNHVHAGTTGNSNQQINHIHNMQSWAIAATGGGGAAMTPMANNASTLTFQTPGNLAQSTWPINVVGGVDSVDLNAHTHSFNTNNPTGGEVNGAAHNNIPRYYGLLKLMKVKRS
jgi:hypothetical protein